MSSFARGFGPIFATCLLFTAAVQAATDERMPDQTQADAGLDLMETAHRSQGTGLFVAEDFEFGPYRISKVKRSVVSKSGFSFGASSKETQKSNFGFQFNGGGQTWQGRCDFKSRERAVALGKSTHLSNRQSQLHCSCNNAAEQATLNLDDEWLPMEGQMQLGASAFSVTQVTPRRSEGGLTEAALGYRVRAGNGSHPAAVEVLYPGRIWLQRDLPAEQAEPMACLLSALMLYGPQQ